MTSVLTRPDPLVSIGVPVHNGEAFLERALRSLVAQELDSLEIIVCDNASEDGTEDIARSFVSGDGRVSYHRSPSNRGAAWNFNRAFRLARGRYFKWAACDDECRPQLVPKCVEVLEESPHSVVLCYPRTLLIDADSRVVDDFEDDLDLSESEPHLRLARLLRSQTEYHPIFGLIRADVLRGTRLIDRFVASDIALLAELALAGSFREVPERLFARRFHAGTSVIANPDPQKRARWFDPANRARVVLPTTRLALAFAGSVARSPLAATEKVRCFDVIGRDWVTPRWRTIAGELKQATLTSARNAERRRARPVLPHVVGRRAAR